MADVRTPELVINKLTKQQYENIQNPSDTEIYLVPEDEEHKPICYPTTASDVGVTSMVVKSSVSDNGKILTENGFVYNTSGNPTVSDTKVICDLGVGFFEKKLENLIVNTEYHIKSYGQNSSGLVYGSELVQRTLPSPIPVEYQLVEYLESSGTQYIGITNFNGFESGDYLLIEAKNDNTSQSFIDVGGTTNRLELGYSTNNVNLRFGNYSRIDAKSSTNFIIQEITDYLRYNINSVFIYQLSGFSIASSYLMKLFTGAAKISHFKIIYGRQNINLDMYPVYRISDSKPGMYDIVNNVFYTNQGTGEFVVGPDKEFDE